MIILSNRLSNVEDKSKLNFSNIFTYSILIIPASQKCSCVPENKITYRFATWFQNKRRIIKSEAIQPTPVISWEWNVSAEGIYANHHDNVRWVDVEVSLEGSMLEGDFCAVFGECTIWGQMAHTVRHITSVHRPTTHCGEKTNSYEHVSICHWKHKRCNFLHTKIGHCFERLVKDESK